MYRTLFDIGPFSIHTYGVALAVAFWLGIELSAREARKRGMDPIHIVDLGIVILLSSVAGSRLLYVLGHLEDYRGDLLGMFKVWEGGLTFYGGLIAGVIFGIGFLKVKKLPVREAIDVIAPQIALGIAIARIGCFFNGCCFGTETGLPWACRFPADSQAGWVLPGIGLHPTQLYSAVANFVIFLFLRRRLRAQHRSGTVFYAFLIIYGLWRFAIDYLRYYEERMYLTAAGANFTWNQIVSICIIAIGAILIVRSRGSGGRVHGQ
jgi:phosphatidylglycerol:prolipoprotein diacylglycerol transferase